MGVTVALEMPSLGRWTGGTGHLRLLVEPATAEVYIGGIYAGLAETFATTPHGTRVRAGTQRVEIRAPGHRPVRFEIVVPSGRSVAWHGALTAVDVAQ